MPGLWDRLVMLRSGVAEAEAPQSTQRSGRASDPPPRRRVDLRGRVVRTSLRPTSGGTESFVGHLDSDLGVVELVWLGRRHLAGVEVGATLQAHGLLAVDRGRMTIFNPDYALEPSAGKDPA